MSSSPSMGVSSISAADLAVCLTVFADLLDAGLPAHRALAALESFAPKVLVAVLPTIQAQLRQGKSVAATLDEANIGIPSVVTGVIGAGEMGGGLAAAVRRAAVMMDERAAFRAALVGALAYPALIFASGAASVGVLLFVVLPRFASMLGDVGQDLPASTSIVLATADVLRGAAVPVLFGTAAVTVALRVCVSTPEGRRRWHSWLLNAPLLGDVRFAAATGRSCGALAALLESGLPLGPALPLAARATGDAALAARFAAARVLLSRGIGLSRAFDQARAVSETGIRLTRAGEESGRLAAMLGHASKLERERATRLTRTSVRLLEPILIISFGAIVALVAGALLQAVYSVRPGG